jgi:predicted nucleic acid-binding protein
MRGEISPHVAAYCDSSVFIALYLPDRHAQDLMRLVADFRPRFLVTPLHKAEWSHAVFERVSKGELTSADAQQVLARFERDSVRRWREAEMPEGAMERSMELTRRFAKTFGTTSADAMHVACALGLRASQFWTVDKRVADLATGAGLAVCKPGVGQPGRKRPEEDE